MMAEQHLPPHSPQPAEPVEVLQAIALERDANFTLTYSRFSIAKEGSMDGIIVNHSGERERYLVTPNDAGVTTDLYNQLTRNDVPQFQRQATNSELSVYELPLETKPLQEERVFITKLSDETYVSDQELYEGLGVLWHRVWQVTKRLPTAPIGSTALLDFAQEGNKLVPIPPYGSWEIIEDADTAQKMLSNHIEQHLRKQVMSRSYRNLLQMLQKGWEKEHGSAN